MAEVTEGLHIAMCQAVASLNQGDEPRIAHGILRQALVDYADAATTSPDAEQRAREIADRIIAPCYEPTDKPLAEGTQQLDGTWMFPIWGCDTLDHLRDAMIGALAAALSTLRDEAEQAELDEIEARLNSATPGPWVVTDGQHIDQYDHHPNGDRLLSEGDYDANYHLFTKDDVAFIAHAPADIRRLLEIARRKGK
jgi:hypothetical protein